MAPSGARPHFNYITTVVDALGVEHEVFIGPWGK